MIRPVFKALSDWPVLLMAPKRASQSKLSNYFENCSKGNDLECYSCQFGYDWWGNILQESNAKCHEANMEDAAVRTRVCPSYMNAACFTAATWHTDADGNEAVEDYKGQGFTDRPS